MQTRATGAARGVVFIHSSPKAMCPHVEWAIGRALGEARVVDWLDQPVLRGTFRAEFAWTGHVGDGARLASALRGWDELRFEVTEEPSASSDGGRWMHTPMLGVFYAQVDSIGNTVVPEDRIRYAMEIAGTDAIELQRELRLALGQAWDDELEAFRHAADHAPVIWLHQVG
ncbi:DUF3145 domain-containing protein [Agromyces sp. MMS24-JH15]|uniref:DUF3145 domain-containing protein n=1 Tax=Agromyces sp. MMS24-JH15 TaxID=3243765 RepID=UPI003749FB4E